MINANVQIPADVHAMLTDEATRRGVRFPELAGMILATAVLDGRELARAPRRVPSASKLKPCATLSPAIAEAIKVSGLERADEAISRAVANGLDEAAIAERISHWQSLPDGQQSPGMLFNWLAFKGSYKRSKRIESRTEASE